MSEGPLKVTAYYHTLTPTRGLVLPEPVLAWVWEQVPEVRSDLCSPCCQVPW